MVTAWKVKSENEETQEKIRARAVVTTELGEGMAEPGQQIAKLMAALTQTGQGSTPSRSWVVPRNVAIDGGTVVGAPLVTQTPTMVGVVLAR